VNIIGVFNEKDLEAAYVAPTAAEPVN